MLLVYGIGVSGVACVDFLLSRNEQVCVYDDDKAKLKDFFDKKLLDNKCVLLTKLDEKALVNVEKLILSPTVRLNEKLVNLTKRFNIKVFGEFEFASQFCLAPIFGVTGTNGKTTTVNFIHQMLVFNDKKSFLVGNVGTPFCEMLNKIGKTDVVIAELSNFQLEQHSNLHLQSAAITNIAPDHLDKYNSFDEYYMAKQNICWVASKVFLNFDDELVRVLNKRCNEFAYFSVDNEVSDGLFIKDLFVFYAHRGCTQKVLSIENFPFKQRHNLSNLLCAISICLEMGLSANEIEKNLSRLTLPRHRVEFVRNVEGIDYYNDSKATNIHAVMSALDCFKNRKVTLLLGGSEKHEDWTKLSLPPCVSNVVTFGFCGKKIAKALKKQTRVFVCESLFDGVILAKEKANDVVLLSPGCASFDEFFSFEERGDYFCEIVNDF